MTDRVAIVHTGKVVDVDDIHVLRAHVDQHVEQPSVMLSRRGSSKGSRYGLRQVGRHPGHRDTADNAPCLLLPQVSSIMRGRKSAHHRSNMRFRVDGPAHSFAPNSKKLTRS
jgi:hypothetical protein